MARLNVYVPEPDLGRIRHVLALEPRHFGAIAGMFFANAYVQIMPAFTTALGAGETGYGLLLSAGGLGSVVGTLTVDEIIRTPLFVPESMGVLDLLARMRAERVHLAAPAQAPNDVGHRRLRDVGRPGPGCDQEDRSRDDGRQREMRVEVAGEGVDGLREPPAPDGEQAHGRNREQPDPGEPGSKTARYRPGCRSRYRRHDA